jgi:phospholipid transport system substrate-binding protein
MLTTGSVRKATPGIALFIVLLSVLGIFGAGASRAADEAKPAAPATAPDVLVRDTAQKVLDALDQRRADLQAHPEQIRQIVDQFLLPVFDVDYAGRVVLGQAARDASPEQRQKFVQAFYSSLVRTYGTGLLKFTSETMHVLPYKAEPGADRTRVRTEVVLDDGTKVPVDYSLHVTDKGWMFYDVTIEGISYLTNYRKMVASEVSRKGLDGLIAELEQGTVPEAIEADKKESGS